MKQMSLSVLPAVIVMVLAACETNPLNTFPTNGDSDTVGREPYDQRYSVSVDEAMSENAGGHEDAEDYTWDIGSERAITLNGDAISVTGTGVTVDGTVATITAGGTYRISGTLNDGRIIVDSDDDTIVRLILDNAVISSSRNAPLSVAGAEKTVIILADGSLNTMTDPADYIFDDPDDDEPNAAVFSKDDLSVYGDGTLTINASYNDGLASKDGLIIKSGTIQINAADDGIRGKDYLIIKGGSISITAGGDGLKSDNDDADKGYILVEDGQLTITCANDGLQAETDALIRDCTLTLVSGGGSGITPGEDSAKGIKANNWLVIDGGSLNINASDDAVHSDAHIVINDGDISLATGDDAVHADSSLVINEGTVNITGCVEGIESYVIAVNGGEISVVASDDCFNSTAGTKTEMNDNSCTYIYGGRIVLSTTGGDGLDSNGSIVMSGGVVIIHGPSNDPEVMIDYNGSFPISGGLLIASGSSSRMIQAPGTQSEQNSLKLTFRSSLGAGTLFHLQNSDGDEVVTFKPIHRYQSIVFSAEALVKGETYTVYTGGTSTGTDEDGLYTGGAYAGGTAVKTFTVSSAVTSITE